MTLMDIVVLLGLIIIAVQFWRIRAITEFVQHYLANYCEKMNLQLLSVARSKTSVAIHRGKLDWRTEFRFEFSSDGSNRYQGVINLQGKTVTGVEVPPHTI